MDHRTHSSKDKIVLYPFCNCFRVKMLKLACVGMPVYWLDMSVSVEMKWNSHYTNAPVRMNLTKVLTVGGSITVWLVSSFTSLDSTASLLTIFSFLVRSSLFKLETSGQSYKQFTLVNYDSRVIPDLKTPHIKTQGWYIMIIKYL